MGRRAREIPWSQGLEVLRKVLCGRHNAVLKGSRGKVWRKSSCVGARRSSGDCLE